MAAVIRDSREGSERRPVLVDKIDVDNEVYAVVILPREEGFITAMDDKTIRVWLKRETGKYWPSVCFYCECNPTALFYHDEPRRLFVGLETGNVAEFAVGEDYNKITMLKQYLAHKLRVTGVYYSLEHDWMLSTSRDKYFSFHSTDNLRRIGSYLSTSGTTCIAYDTASKHCFVGDSSGNITFLKLTDSGCEFKATLNGHADTVTSLDWDSQRKFLYSSSMDKIIICWDIGGQKGATYDLEGHKDPVKTIISVPASRQLISGSLDSKIVVWDMDAKRKENPQWAESDFCQFCKAPFFWNFRSMWETKSVGKRQHHCRRCGAACCDACSSQRTPMPVLGHEFQVRICKECQNKISNDEKVPLATFHESKHGISLMSYDEHRKFLLTAGTDRLIKIWDMNSILSL